MGISTGSGITLISGISGASGLSYSSGISDQGFFSPNNLPNLAIWLDPSFGIQTNAAASFAPNNGLVNDSPSGLPTGSGARSISAWIYKNTSGLQIGLRWGNMATQDGFYLFDSGGQIGCSLYGTSVVDPSSYSLNTWYHYVITYDSSGTTKIYRNGSLVVTGSQPVASTSNTLLRIGIEGNGSTGWNGRISMAGIWNRVLSGSEISELYNAGVGLYASELTSGLLSGCVSYYDLKELTSTTRVDSVGSNNLTVSGSVPAAGGLKNVSAVDGDPIAIWTARTGQQFIQNTFSARPVWRSGSGKPYLQFDGVNDFMNCASTGITTIGDSTGGLVIATAAYVTASQSGIFAVGNGTVNSGALNFDESGVAKSRFISITAVGTSDLNASTSLIGRQGQDTNWYAYKNGSLVQAAQAASANAPADVATVGALNNIGTLFLLTGRLYQAILYTSDVLSDAGNISSLNNYLASTMP